MSSEINNNIKSGNTNNKYVNNRSEQITYNIKNRLGIESGKVKPAFIGGNLKDERTNDDFSINDWSVKNLSEYENPISVNRRKAQEEAENAKKAEEGFRKNHPEEYLKRQEELRAEQNAKILEKQEAEKAQKAEEAKKDTIRQSGPNAIKDIMQYAGEEKSSFGYRETETAKSVYNYVCQEFAPFRDDDACYNKLPQDVRAALKIAYRIMGKDSLSEKL